MCLQGNRLQGGGDLDQSRISRLSVLCGELERGPSVGHGHGSFSAIIHAKPNDSSPFQQDRGYLALPETRVRARRRIPIVQKLLETEWSTEVNQRGADRRSIRDRPRRPSLGRLFIASARRRLRTQRRSKLGIRKMRRQNGEIAPRLSVVERALANFRLLGGDVRRNDRSPHQKLKVDQGCQRIRRRPRCQHVRPRVNEMHVCGILISEWARLCLPRRRVA